MTGDPKSTRTDQNVINVWVVDLTQSRETAARDYQLLSDDERRRADCFRFRIDRDRFVIARATLRKILASYLQMHPSQLAFKYSEYGKPTLAIPHTELSFNTSRSHERALIACTHTGEIGVDIEWIGRELDVDNLARRFFTVRENEKILATPSDVRHLAFLRCWTCKEAFVKAIGKGLSLDLNDFDVSEALASDGVLSTREETFRINDYSLTTFGASQGYVSALVTKDAQTRLVVKPWMGQQ